MRKFIFILFYIKVRKNEKIIVKVVFSLKKNNSTEPQTRKISFEAGLTPKIMQEIQKADVLEISKKLAKKGIPADFKDNKVIAWCCNKAIEIFEQLNKNYKQGLALPKGIFVEDFEKLNIEHPNMYGFCNLQPTKLIKKSDNLVPSRVIYFNNFKTQSPKVADEYKWLYNWDFINSISDVRFLTKQSGTDCFMDIFIHELTHASHEDRLLSKLGGKTLANKIAVLKQQQKITEYQKKYGQKIAKICDYALTDPFEAVSCDVSRIIANTLDKNTLMPINNPFIGTPYENLSFWQRVNIPNYSNEERPLKEILRNFWNGKFE